MKEFSIDPANSDSWALYMDQKRGKLIPKAHSKAVSSVLRHGDMIFLLPVLDQTGESQEQQQQPSQVQLDEVDKILSKMDGRVIRSKDEQL